MTEEREARECGCPSQLVRCAHFGGHTLWMGPEDDGGGYAVILGTVLGGVVVTDTVSHFRRLSLAAAEAKYELLDRKLLGREPEEAVTDAGS